MTVAERFWSKVDRDGPVPEHRPELGACWEWTAFRDGKGYGQFSVSGRMVRRAHRVAYEVSVGQIPECLEIDHLCRNRGCVNPAHLEPVTHRENVMRGMAPNGINARKTHCLNGHPFAGDNLTVTSSGRRCNECARQRSRAWRAARSGAAA